MDYIDITLGGIIGISGALSILLIGKYIDNRRIKKGLLLEIEQNLRILNEVESYGAFESLKGDTYNFLKSNAKLSIYKYNTALIIEDVFRDIQIINNNIDKLKKYPKYLQTTAGALLIIEIEDEKTKLKAKIIDLQDILNYYIVKTIMGLNDEIVLEKLKNVYTYLKNHFVPQE